jgi:hypothetical protein
MTPAARAADAPAYSTPQERAEVLRALAAIVDAPATRAVLLRDELRGESPRVLEFVSNGMSVEQARMVNGIMAREGLDFVRARVEADARLRQQARGNYWPATMKR